MYIIVSAHGKLATELINSSEMIFGKQEKIQAVEFVPGENTEHLKNKYKECLKNVEGSEDVLILVDLFGGSPYNAAFEIALTNENIDILTGVNIPMLLEILAMREDSTIEDIIGIINENKNQYIRSCKQSLKVLDEEEL